MSKIKKLEESITCFPNVKELHSVEDQIKIIENASKDNAKEISLLDEEIKSLNLEQENLKQITNRTEEKVSEVKAKLESEPGYTKATNFVCNYCDLKFDNTDILK